MSQNLAIPEDRFACPSLKKHQIYNKYTEGVLNWSQVAEEIGKIQPPPPQLSKKQRIAMIVTTFLVTALIPPWARRDD